MEMMEQYFREVIRLVRNRAALTIAPKEALRFHFVEEQFDLANDSLKRTNHQSEWIEIGS